jgi:hypothetical protein
VKAAIMRNLLVVLLLLANACRAADGDPDPVLLQAEEEAAEAAEWRSSPSDGVELDAGTGGVVRVTTGPHAVLWPVGAGAVEPPYGVTALLRKQAGRTHEGYGLVFGGSGLEAPEEQQAYSYFLVRGDGSFLVRRREGAEVPIVRAWTAHAAVNRDDENGRATNELTVLVGEQEVVFLVNGQEVDRQPLDALRLEGTPGVRVAHDLQLEVADFRVTLGEGVAELEAEAAEAP